MLQAIVGEHHVALRMRGQQRVDRGDAIASDPDRQRVGSKQQRFVTHDGGIIPWRDRARCARGSAVAAADDARMPAGLLERGRERAGKRRLARAPDEDAADDDHWHANCRAAQHPRAVRGAPDRDERAKHER